MAHVLVIDDDAELRRMIAEALVRDGHQVEAAADAHEFDERLRKWADCILLDVMMPGEDGFAFCRRIRALVDCPILFLTARAEESDVLTGLGVGADDYLCKPFRIAELRARVNAHLRREGRRPHSRLVCGEIVFDLLERRVLCGEQPIGLSRGEYAICEYLALHPGQTFTKEQIYEAAFGFDGQAGSTVVTEHVRSIRAKFREAGHNPIETIWGVGYRWVR